MQSALDVEFSSTLDLKLDLILAQDDLGFDLKFVLFISNCFSVLKWILHMTFFSLDVDLDQNPDVTPWTLIFVSRLSTMLVVLRPRPDLGD